MERIEITWFGGHQCGWFPNLETKQGKSLSMTVSNIDILKASGKWANYCWQWNGHWIGRKNSEQTILLTRENRKHSFMKLL
jgi:hypothetical protein